MNCEEFALLLEAPKQERTAEAYARLAAHASTCADCARVLAIRTEMRAMEQEERVPEAFPSAWRDRIRKEERRMTEQRKNTWKRTLAAAAALIVVVGGTTISYVNGWGLDAPPRTQNSQESRSMMTTDYSSEYSYDSGAGLYMMTAESAMAKSAPRANEAQPETKIIRTVDFTIKTRRYDTDYAAMQALIESAGGRVESLSISGDGTPSNLRNARLTLRIPAEQLDAFITGANGVGVVSSYSERSTDVSEDYYDVQARLEVQLAKLERLETLLSKAETVDDLIELENAIGDTQYMIDSYTGQINGYDSRVSDSYVNVTIRELSAAEAVEEPQIGFFARVKNALTASVSIAGDLLMSFAMFALTVLPWCAAAGGIVLVVRAVVKGFKKKK